MPVFFLAEDDEEDRLFFLEALVDVNHNSRCIMAINGEEALQKLQTMQAPPDYIFLDVNIPKKNGIECLSEIKMMPFLVNVPVILYSTLFSASDQNKASSLGADDMLVKPYSIADLISYLKKLIFKNSH